MTGAPARRGSRLMAVGFALTATSGLLFASDAEGLVERAARTMQADWAATPGYAFIQRDASLSGGKRVVRTHQVVMIADSDYYLLVAVDDKLIPPDQRRLELLKLQAEIEKRSREDSETRRRRSETYRKQREQNGALLLEFPKAFRFELIREERSGGSPSFLLAATPRPGYQPPNRTARILTGMRGQLLIEGSGFHWVCTEATIMRAVPIFGFLAKVLPGTQFELEMAPVAGSVWLASRFRLQLTASRFWFKTKQTIETTYSEYRPNGEVIQELLRELADGSIRAEPAHSHADRVNRSPEPQESNWKPDCKLRITNRDKGGNYGVHVNNGLGNPGFRCDRPGAVS